jgi:hypothetical protein
MPTQTQLCDVPPASELANPKGVHKRNSMQLNQQLDALCAYFADPR